MPTTTEHHRLCAGEGGSVAPDRCALCGLLGKAETELLSELRDEVQRIRRAEKQWITNDPDDYNSTLSRGSVSTADAMLKFIEERKSRVR